MSISALLSVGSEEHPEVFKHAETACKHYAREVAPMTDKEQFDFRRGFELGCYFTHLQRPELRLVWGADECDNSTGEKA